MTPISRGSGTSMRLFRITLAALVLLGAGALFVAPTAQAASFALTYELEGGAVLTATIEGTLQGDNNTVLVTGISDVTVNAFALPPFASVDAFSEFAGGPPADPVLTLNGGPVMDFVACATAICDAGFLFAVGPPANLSFGGNDVFDSEGLPVETIELFNSDRYSLVALATVPGPATLLLLVSAVTGVGMARAWRRRR